MNKFLLYSIILTMDNPQDDNSNIKFLKLMTEAKNSCLQEIEDVYGEAEKVIDIYLKDKNERN